MTLQLTLFKFVFCVFCFLYYTIIWWTNDFYITRNAFCGTWYLPHSHVHNERTVPIIMAGCIAHARNGRISTSGEKSDVTIVFFDPAFLWGAKISAICVHLRQIWDYLIFAWVFRTFWPKMGVLWGKIGEGVVRYWPLTNSFFLFGVFTSVPILVKIDQEMRPWECSQTDRQTDWHTDRRKPIL